MKILFVLKQKKNVETFADTIRVLTERGHSVALAVQEHSDTRADQYRDWIEPATPKAGEAGMVLAGAMSGASHRSLGRRRVAAAQPARLRSLPAAGHAERDQAAGAQRPEAARGAAHRGRQRVVSRRPCADCRSRKIGRLDEVFALAERQLPVDPVYESFLREQAPDVMLISPLVHFGSAQADFVAAARARRHSGWDAAL